MVKTIDELLEDFELLLITFNHMKLNNLTTVSVTFAEFEDQILKYAKDNKELLESLRGVERRESTPRYITYMNNDRDFIKRFNEFNKR